MASLRSSKPRVLPMTQGYASDSAPWKSPGLTALNADTLERAAECHTDEHAAVSLGEKGTEIDMVLLEFFERNNDKPSESPGFPLIISPKKDRSLEFLTRFFHGNKEWLGQQILQYGAVLVRGFQINSAAHVETAVRAYEPKLHNTYRGTSPRLAQPDSAYVFSAAEVPSHFPIAQHLEMSFLPAPPKQLYFAALQAPQTVGGETALADFRQVYRDIPMRLRDKLATKKLLYTRTHYKTGARFLTHDVASMQSWVELFGTDDPAVVEEKAREDGMPMRWVGKDHDAFVSEFVSEPFQLHPDTKEPVWFNHAQVFHWTTFPAELYFAWQRTREWRFLVRAVLVALKCILMYGVFRRTMALHVTFGDGTPISILEMHQIRQAIHQNMVFSRWQQGDLLLIDNFGVSHGRQPTYDAGRKIVVAWSEPVEKKNEPVEVSRTQ